MDPNDRDYTNGEIIVHWRPNLCVHATTCYRELIEVFDPRNRPWINMKGAPTERIIEIVRECPTGALTYDWNDSSKVSYKPGDGAISIPPEKYEEDQQDKPVEIRIMKNGPYVVEGQFKVMGPDGLEMKKMRITSFCRCGRSGSMPLCDGSHRMSGFITD
jgi:uncharacterized Fe-S cluster protein YjdI